MDRLFENGSYLYITVHPGSHRLDNTLLVIGKFVLLYHPHQLYSTTTTELCKPEMHEPSLNSSLSAPHPICHKG